MPSSADQPAWFIVAAYDRDLCCAVLESRFAVEDLAELHALLGAGSDDDPDFFMRSYCFDNFAELSPILARFSVSFDPAPLAPRRIEFGLARQRRLRSAPYLVHTGYELPLLLDGRKKLARMDHSMPPEHFDDEASFDVHVQSGFLHKEEVIETFARPIRKYTGHRTAYYTPRGEEWRIPAMRLIYEALEKSGGWNEHFERLEGMLFGYEDWQNDWWINVGLHGGGFGGRGYYCSVDAAGLAWIESTGFRALPPPRAAFLVLHGHRWFDETPDYASILGDGDCAVVRAKVLDNYPHKPAQLQAPGLRHVPADEVPQLNRNLRGLIEVVATRDPPAASAVAPRPGEVDGSEAASA